VPAGADHELILKTDLAFEFGVAEVSGRSDEVAEEVANELSDEVTRWPTK